jgi:hypothetical protein
MKEAGYGKAKLNLRFRKDVKLTELGKINFVATATLL